MITAALRCRVCEATAVPGAADRCERCDGPQDVVYAWDELRGTVTRGTFASGPPSMWRYAPLLPVDGDGDAPGWTPLVPAERLSEELGVDLRLKLENANPSGSFKDRLAALAGAAAAELGLETLCCASTGNLGDAVSTEAAARGMDAVVLAPAGLEGAAGGHVIAVRGSYDDCRRLERELAALFPWAFLDGNVGVFAAEGAKTVTYEIAEQLGWRLPDAVVSPVGSGSLFAKAAQGFSELRALGLVDGPVPRLYGAQPEGCRPVTSAFEDERPISRVHADTRVGALAVGNPVDGDLALGAARTTGGAFVSVAEEAVESHAVALADATGVYTDGPGGVALGGLVAAVDSGLIRPGELVVLVVTGLGRPTGDPSAATVAPTIDAVLDRLGVIG
jgi:threonine synthase